jgi:hypothetical protein
MPDLRPPAQIEAFLEELYATSETRMRAGIDLVFNTIFDLMDGLGESQFNDTMVALGGPLVFKEKEGSIAPQWPVIDEILKHADPWKMPDSVSIALLSTTFLNKEWLSEYFPYVDRLRKRLRETGDRRRVKELLKGFI